MPNIQNEQPAYLESLEFKIAEEYTLIKGLTNISPSVNGKIVTYTTYNDNGWDNNQVTGKGFKITVDGYRIFGDPGNDELANTKFAIGEAANKEFRYTFADGSALEFKAAVNVTAFSGGAPTDLIPLKGELNGKGQPVEVAAPEEEAAE